tara:strand:- start:505 stop:747 length:243 start_codon:yes stop_codon:yes gene_type:complete
MKEENMNAEQLKNEGWNIDSSTRYLVYKRGLPEEELYTEFRGLKYPRRYTLMRIYATLGVDKWGSVGIDDLLDESVQWEE